MVVLVARYSLCDDFGTFRCKEFGRAGGAEMTRGRVFKNMLQGGWRIRPAGGELVAAFSVTLLEAMTRFGANKGVGDGAVNAAVRTSRFF